MELRIVAHLEGVVVVGDAELAVQEPEEPVGLVHQHRRRRTTAAGRGRGPPRHELAERGGGGAHGVVGGRDRLHGGQRVWEALVVEERAGEKLPGVAAAASRTVNSSDTHRFAGFGRVREVDVHSPVDDERGGRGPVYGDGGDGRAVDGRDVGEELEERRSPGARPVRGGGGGVADLPIQQLSPIKGCTGWLVRNGKWMLLQEQGKLVSLPNGWLLPCR